MKLPIALLLIPSLLLGCPDESKAPSSEQAQGQKAAPPKVEPKKHEAEGFDVLADSFADVQILRYRIPGFEKLPLQQKEMLYYLYEAAQSGRDISYDQKNKHNLAVRRTLEAIVGSDKVDKATPEYAQLLDYAKQVWFARGIHHDYSSQKLKPDFSKESFATWVKAVDPATLPLDGHIGEEKTITAEQLIEKLTPVMFDPKIMPVRVNRDPKADLVVDSANNFYEGVTQKEVEAYYKKKIDPKDPTPISWGLNSKLVKENGKIVEKVWRIDGMYGPAIEKIVYWLKKAAPLSENEAQKAALNKLIEYYETGDLRKFDEYNILWVKDTDSRIDVVNGFIETYGDALGYRASWESVVSIRDLERTKRIATIGGNAQWFENHSPIADSHKKKNVVGISAKVITVVSEAGDAAPSTPVGINLPNAQWIRKDHGSKSVFLGNIVDAYEAASKDSGILEEFALTPAEIERAKEFGPLGYALKVDMHEVIGHASGQMEPGVGTPKETLKNYASALEEARADLVALYYVMDPKLIELGVMKSLDVGKASYDGYIRNGLLVQLARILPGANIEQSHMRNRQMISNWVFEKGSADKVIERVDKDGKIYFVIRDYDKLRELFGQLLAEVQRIKSQGDFEAGKRLIETYGVKVDKEIHDNVLARYAKLPAKPYSGFIQPKLVPIERDGKIVDVKVEYPKDFVEQMMELSKQYSFLPTYN